MFGHQNDIIAQDQRKDATVTLDQGAINDLTASQPVDQPVADPVMVTVPPQQDDTDDAQVSSVPPLSPTSVDGFSAPSAKLSSPFAYMQSQAPVSRPVSSSDDDAQPSEPIQLGTVSDESTAPQGTDVEPEVAPELAPESAPEQYAPEVPELSAPEVPAAEQTPTDTYVAAPAEPADLEAIRAEALNELSPLVGTLDLDPEEKFNTVMSLIRSTDNHTLLNDALAAAKAIPDEKKRAQALFDVISEIDYFSGHDKQAV